DAHHPAGRLCCLDREQTIRMSKMGMSVRRRADARRGLAMAQTSTQQAAVGRQPGFRRDVGFVALMFVSLGSIIGSGWLLGALTAATSAGGASIVSWLLAGVIIVLLALVHSELGAAYHLAGGTGRWPRLAFGSLGGFTAGWGGWLQAVTIAPIAVGAALC